MPNIKVSELILKIASSLFFWLCLALFPPILNIISFKVGMVRELDDKYLLKILDFFNEETLFWTIGGAILFFLFSLIVQTVTTSTMRLFKKPSSGEFFMFAASEISSQAINFGSIIISIYIYMLLMNDCYIAHIKSDIYKNYLALGIILWGCGVFFSLLNKNAINSDGPSPARE